MNHTGLSQAGQEEFVMFVLNNKCGGTFLEIGTEHPVLNNNTFYLERFLNWNGVLIEYENRWEEYYKKWRTSEYIIGDSCQVNYLDICEYLAKDNVIDYLQIDVEVKNGSTIRTLEKLEKDVFDNYKFRVITFEHDIYNGWTGENTRERSRQIFENAGYFRVYSDVKHNLNDNWCVPFEDWYVYPELVDMDKINKIKDDDSLNHDDILKILSNYI